MFGFVLSLGFFGTSAIRSSHRSPPRRLPRGCELPGLPGSELPTFGDPQQLRRRCSRGATKIPPPKSPLNMDLLTFPSNPQTPSLPKTRKKLLLFISVFFLNTGGGPSTSDPSTLFSSIGRRSCGPRAQEPHDSVMHLDDREFGVWVDYKGSTCVYSVGRSPPTKSSVVLDRLPSMFTINRRSHES